MQMKPHLIRVSWWGWRFREGREDLEDDSKSGRPWTFWNPETFAMFVNRWRSETFEWPWARRMINCTLTDGRFIRLFLRICERVWYVRSLFHSLTVDPGQLLNHPPYSPDLTPADVPLFHKAKATLKGRKYQDAESIKKNVTAELSTVSVITFDDWFCQLLGIYIKCLEVKGG